MPIKEEKSTFDIHASIVFQLGESLITDVFQALAELAKNSYDADATYANIEIDSDGAPPEGSEYPNAKGYIIVADNGEGMDAEALKNGWLTISNSLKKQMKAAGKTTERGRTPLGDKGLGRLGVQRLGENLEIVTRPAGKEFDLLLSFSWASFRNEKALTSVPIVIKTRTPAIRKKGTQIIISDVRNIAQWKGPDAEKKVQEELSKVISPFAEIRDFNIKAKLQGKSVDLMEVSEKIRSAAQVKYDISYKSGIFEVTGKASIGFLRTKENARIVKRLVERDGGKKFLMWLSNRKKAKTIGLIGVQDKKQKKWFVEFKKELPLTELLGLALDVDSKPADPGGFYGEVDFYDLGDEKSASLFEKAKAFKELIKSQSGIRVYRDGFGIRLDQDWLKLGSQWTSATSYYGLKPQNTLGYIAISAKENSHLEETTNREGFKVSPHYDNFRGLLDEFVSFAQRAQGVIRREWNEYQNSMLESNAGLPKEASSEEIFTQAEQRLNRAEKLSIPIKESIRKIHDMKIESQKALKSIDSETDKVVVEARKRLKLATSQLDGITKSFEKAAEFISEAHEIRLNNIIIKNRFEQMREQMSQLYETVSLGLTVEAFTHELLNVLDNMVYRTKKIEKQSFENENSQKKLDAYFEFVGTSISALKKQLAHLSPSLKYVRENKENISVFGYFDDLQIFYHSRFSTKNIDLLIRKESEDFNLKVNKGKLNQVVENLLLNSEYWLVEDIRTGKLKSGKITVELEKPYIRVKDNGRGISSSIEPAIFEPFQTTKRRGEGRGLGLFVVSQLLLAEDCTISLLPDLNKAGRPFVFEIDCTGVLNDSSK